MRRACTAVTTGLLALAVSSLAGAAALAQQQQQPPPRTPDGFTSVMGSVLDADGQPVAEIPARLQVHDGHSMVFDESTDTDGSGRARWTHVPAGSGYSARIGATFAGVEYFSDTVTLSPDQAARLQVQVYPVTDQGHPLHLDTLHLIVQVDDPGLYRVLEFLTVSNEGQAAFAGGPALADGRRAGLVIPIPPGATSVRAAPFPSAEDALESDSAQIESDRVLDARPVPPAGRQVAVTYDLVSEGDPIAVRLALPYPTQTVSLLVGGSAAAQVNISGTNLEPQPDQQIGDQQYSMWTAESLAPGTDVAFTIGPLETGLRPDQWALIALGTGLLLAIAAALHGVNPKQGQREYDRLVQEIAQLDQQYEDEMLQDSEYFLRRGAAIEKLEILERSLPSPASAPGTGQPRSGKRRRSRRRK